MVLCFVVSVNFEVDETEWETLKSTGGAGKLQGPYGMCIVIAIGDDSLSSSFHFANDYLRFLTWLSKFTNFRIGIMFINKN